MGIHNSSIDSVRENNLDNEIIELRERIIYLRNYTDTDTGLIELKLENLIEQRKKQGV